MNQRHWRMEESIHISLTSFLLKAWLSTISSGHPLQRMMGFKLFNNYIENQWMWKMKTMTIIKIACAPPPTLGGWQGWDQCVKTWWLLTKWMTSLPEQINSLLINERLLTITSISSYEVIPAIRKNKII